jgi:hypothetical protein
MLAGQTTGWRATSAAMSRHADGHITEKETEASPNIFRMT